MTEDEHQGEEVPPPHEIDDSPLDLAKAEHEARLLMSLRDILNRPTPVTRFLVISMSVIYVFQCLLATSGSFFGNLVGLLPAADLPAQGAILPFNIAGSEWRVFSGIVLHGGLFHVFLNLLVLHSLGRQSEQMWGKGSYLALLFGSAIVGAIFSGFTTVAPSVGISGGIMGLVGGIIGFGLVNQSNLPKGLARGLIRRALFASFIVIGFGLGANFLLGWFGVSVLIDNWGHIGGFIGGVLISFYLPARLPSKNPQPGAERLILILGILMLLMSYGSIAMKFGRITLENSGLVAPDISSLKGNAVWTDPDSGSSIMVPGHWVPAQKGEDGFWRFGNGRGYGVGQMSARIRNRLPMLGGIVPPDVELEKMISDYRENFKEEGFNVTVLGANDKFQISGHPAVHYTFQLEGSRARLFWTHLLSFSPDHVGELIFTYSQESAEYREAFLEIGKTLKLPLSTRRPR